ncbi:MAG: DNA repair protein RecO [Acidimicrobiia bacterium]|nr:DNA repair protein RecO [Acidimicrobiia bacterium]
MAIRNDQGIVLRGYPFGDSHRVVVLISPNNGKLRTVAKGVRKTKSRFGGRLEPFTHVDLVLYEGRDLDTITQVSTIDNFRHLRRDLDSTLAAATMVEVVDAVAQEGEASHRLFLLLKRGLETLDSGYIGPDLVTSFLLKLATAVGIAPSFDRCASCGRSEALERFSFPGGGVVCEWCRSDGGGMRLQPGLLGHLDRLSSVEFAAIGPAGELTGPAMGLARRFLEYHLDRRLLSLDQ